MQPYDERGDRAPLPPVTDDADLSYADACGPGSRFRLRNWRVRWRLIALILVPTMVAVAFGGLRVSTAVGSAQFYSRVERLAELGSDITGLVHELGTERDLTAAYISADRGQAQLGRVQQQYARVNAAVTPVTSLLREINDSYGTTVVANAIKVRNRLDGLQNMRDNASKSRMPAQSVIIVYSEAITDLLAFNDEVTQGAADAKLAGTSRALAAVSRAKEQASQQRGLLYSAALNHSLGPIDLTSLSAAQSREDSEVASFREAATPEQRQLYDDTVIGPQVDLAGVLRERSIALGLSGKGTTDFDLDPQMTNDANEWLKAETTKIDLMREVERNLAKQVIAGSRSRENSAVQSAILGITAVVIVLILVLVITLIMARSLVRPLRRLRAGALDIAGNRLPELVRRLRDPEAGNELPQVEPIDVETTDEIGEVARSFDEVHRVAVRLASNEALLRGNVNAMFVNLSRRSQSLIERQLRLIENLEQSEQDAARLDSLFKLDHLATRMRRNGENLLVLGGQDQARKWNKPVPLVDIVRASLSEVEQYERITLRIQDEVSVNGRCVNDLVHLVAELVENSTSFSPEHTKVAVSGHLLSGGGAMLQISDNGVGMSPEELERANWRLANPPTIDVSISRRMGLFVVGRLAQRHGIRVELRAALSGGLTGFVILPSSAIMQKPGTHAPNRLDSPMDTGPIRTPSARSGAADRLGSDRPGLDLSGRERPGPGRDKPGGERLGLEGVGMEGVGMEGVGGERAGSDRPGTDRPGTDRPGHRRRAPFSAEPSNTPPVPDTPREPMRSPSPSSLPKRKPAPTSPPGRSSGPTAPTRTGPASRSPGTPPASRPPSQAPTGGSSGESRAANENGGRSPIFEAMQSEWFQRRNTESMSPSEASPLPAEWSAPGDEGWRAAETIREPATGGKTSSGLPKRVPGSNRIPGTAAAGAAAPRPVAEPPQAENVRNRFASFQQGTRRGRAATRPEDDERENQ